MFRRVGCDENVTPDKRTLSLRTLSLCCCPIYKGDFHRSPLVNTEFFFFSFLKEDSVFFLIISNQIFCPSFIPFPELGAGTVKTSGSLTHYFFIEIY